LILKWYFCVQLSLIQKRENVPRYFLHLRYDGTAYHGWQLQQNTTRTVQHVLQQAMGKLLPEKQAFVMGCGRTDTGVHAEDFYVHFDTARADLHVDPRDFLFKLNRALPNDVSAFRVLPVMDKANARFDAISRTYEYRISRNKNPFLRDLSWMVYGPLNIEAMAKAANIIANVTDFKSFAKSNDQPHDNNCIIHESQIIESNELLIYRIKANRFIRNMVRAITGTLVEIGKGQLDPDDIHRIIADRNRASAGVSAPAQGLFLVKIEYPDSIFKAF
jgi:tRNA pseudouridine38-40 synthase